MKFLIFQEFGLYIIRKLKYMNILTSWLLMNPEVYYRPSVSPPLYIILNKIFPVSSIITHLPQIHINIILPSTSRPP